VVRAAVPPLEGEARLTSAGEGGSGRIHVPALDGLRGVSFSAVFLHHAIPTGIPALSAIGAAGWGGVSFFFVLSGFLVTWLLLREEDRDAAAGGPGRFRILRFWARRALRIWPLYFLALAVAFFLLPQFAHPWCFGPSIVGGAASGTLLREQHGWTAPLFLFNWSILRHEWFTYGFSFNALWSVSVEEQFYVLWPLVLLVVPGRARRAVILSGIVLSAAWRTRMIWTESSYTSWYVHTGALADALLAGALLATSFRARGNAFGPVSPVLVAGVVAGLGFHVWAGLPGDRGPLAESLRMALLPWVGAGLVRWALAPGLLARAASSAPLRFLGTISYGLYVWHVLVIHVVRHLMEPLHVRSGGPLASGVWYVLAGVAAFAGTLLVAWPSFLWFERPFLRWKEKFA
jgi:peptidoglycan/LPS O-acetylase OafA/YrhL